MSRLHFRAVPIALAVMASLSCWPSASSAQSTPARPVPSAIPGTLRLTDQQKMAVLNGNTEDSVDTARAGLGGSGIAGRGIHGEIGAMIGSHGTRGAYGVAAIPLGNDAAAVVSFESSHFGDRH
jgi:hypothetical protein